MKAATLSNEGKLPLRASSIAAALGDSDSGELGSSGIWVIVAGPLILELSLPDR